MSENSGISPQLVSLPKGGGALQGIGEAFQPDLFTGTGNFTLPIAVPPGRCGYQPSIHLVYSTGAGNGPFGLGWRLDTPAVTRKTSRGVPEYDDDRDVFRLTTSDDLVPVTDWTNGRRRFRPRTEGSMSRIEHVRTATVDYWSVRTRDGTTSEFGSAQSSTGDDAVIASPDDPSRIFAWRIASSRDAVGNAIYYRYQRESAATDGPHRWSQSYIDRIEYSEIAGRPTRYFATIQFVYEDRPDPFSDGRPGFEVRTVKRCRRIEVRTHADADRLTRIYHFTYLDDLTPDPWAQPMNGVSLLARVAIEGVDGATSETAPAIELEYTRFDPGARRYMPLTAADGALPERRIGQGGFELADLFGRGVPDVVALSSTPRYWRNRGDGSFDFPRTMAFAPAHVAAVQDLSFGDADGDGRADLLVAEPLRPGYYPVDDTGGWDSTGFVSYDPAPPVPLNDPESRLVDLDGDGVVDLLRTGEQLELYYQHRGRGWDRAERRPRAEASRFPDVSFSDARVRLADMTGDGLQDIVQIGDGRIDYWPYFGNGAWGERMTMRNAPRFADADRFPSSGYDPARLLVGDLDGDGCADIAYLGDGETTVWINQSGNGWSHPVVIPGTPDSAGPASVRIADMLGLGTGGILWTRDFDPVIDSQLKFLDLTGGTKPYLLSEIRNNRGATTRIEYAASTRFWAEDDTSPATRWRTPLPTPVHVVERVIVGEEFSRSKLTSRFAYHHGYWDGFDREFRGFGRVDRYDTEAFYDPRGQASAPGNVEVLPVPAKFFAPPVHSRTWFHLGSVERSPGVVEEIDFRAEYWSEDPPVFARPAADADLLASLDTAARRSALRALRGRTLRMELYALDDTDRASRPVNVTEFLDALHALPMGTTVPQAEWQRQVFFPRAAAQRHTEWDRGSDPMTRVTFHDDVDAYGTARSEISIAVPRGRDYRLPLATPGEAYLVTQVRTDFAQRDEAGVYVVDRAARATSYALANDGTADVFALRAAVLAGTLPRTLIAQELRYYDGAAFTGLPFGQLGAWGLVARTDVLVLDESLIQSAYGATPPYLATGTVAWSADYPADFQHAVPALAGYTFHDGTGEHARGYFARRECYEYDVQGAAGTGHGFRVASRDPLDHTTTIDYDAFGLAPSRYVDAAGLATLVEPEYRVLQPIRVTDANGATTVFRFTPLGFVAGISQRGAHGEGDATLPGTTYAYDLDAPRAGRGPVSVRTVRRVWHDGDPVPAGEDPNATLTCVEYSDGIGRLLQRRAQSDDIVFGDATFARSTLDADQRKPITAATGHVQAAGTPRVIVTGWQRFDNKGRTVQKAEPYYDDGWAFLWPTQSHMGRVITLEYDARGRLLRTTNPDGSETLNVYGQPRALTDPATFDPSPWISFDYDVNDNAGRTHGNAAAAYRDHWNTPSSTRCDARGRVIETIARRSTTGADDLTTTTTYDLFGFASTVTDPLGRTSQRFVHDFAGNPLLAESIDGGARRAVFDAATKQVELRDGRAALLLRAYDALARPTAVWGRDDAGDIVTLREVITYGDAGDPNQPAAERQAQAAAYRLGRIDSHFDEAGRVRFERYDFKGHPARKVRDVIDHRAVAAVYTAAAVAGWRVGAYRVDWAAPGGSLSQRAAQLLDAGVSYATTMTCDACERVARIEYPVVGAFAGSVVVPRYNPEGGLRAVTVDGTAYVEHIAYNAGGQRTLIAYGSGIVTRYAYETDRLRLARQRSERCTRVSTAAVLEYIPVNAGAPLADTAYRYDLAGNILRVTERSPASGIRGTILGENALDRLFTYDPLYQLVSATGREVELPTDPAPWLERARAADPTKAVAYREHYDYGDAGFLEDIQHAHGAGGRARKRTFAPDPASNRLVAMKMGRTTVRYASDASGNLMDEGLSRHFEWDHSNRLKAFRTQVASRGGLAEPSVHAHYLYDGSGQRVLKLVRRQGGAYETIVYLDHLFEHHREHTANGTVRGENVIAHVLDNQRRVALIRSGPALSGDTGPAVQYHFADHLGSSRIVVGATGAFIDREEFSPFGDTTFGSFARKRYRFVGEERDEESGLVYQGARYLAVHLGRWCSTDPAGHVDGTNLFVYARNNPVVLIDPRGTQTISAQIDTIESPGAWFAARTAYDVWDTVSMGTLSKVEQQDNLGTWEGVADSAGTGVRSFSNGASMGLQDHIYESQMKNGPGLDSIEKGVVGGVEDALPVAEAGVLSDPEASTADQVRAVGNGIAKLATLVAIGAGLREKFASKTTPPPPKPPPGPPKPPGPTKPPATGGKYRATHSTSDAAGKQIMANKRIDPTTKTNRTSTAGKTYVEGPYPDGSTKLDQVRARSQLQTEIQTHAVCAEVGIEFDLDPSELDPGTSRGWPRVDGPIDLTNRNPTVYKRP